MLCKDCIHFISRRMKHRGAIFSPSDRGDHQVNSCLLDCLDELGIVMECSRFEAKVSPVEEATAQPVSDEKAGFLKGMVNRFFVREDSN